MLTVDRVKVYMIHPGVIVCQWLIVFSRKSCIIQPVLIISQWLIVYSRSCQGVLVYSRSCQDTHNTTWCERLSVTFCLEPIVSGCIGYNVVWQFISDLLCTVDLVRVYLMQPCVTDYQYPIVYSRFCTWYNPVW